MVTHLVMWSNATLVFYIVAGLICMFCCKMACQREIITGNQRKVGSKEYYLWYIVWLILAIFRCVDNYVGGKDAPSYIVYFENCLNYTNDTTDVFFKLFNQLIRNISNDYHVFFFVYYVIVIFALVLFINEFFRPSASTIPFCILFYLYLRSFTSMRSNFAIAILLIALVFLHRRNYLFTVVLAVCAMLTHVSAYVYVAFIFFYFLYKERKMGLAKSIFIFACAFAVATFTQNLFLSGGLAFLSNVGTGVYASYARRSLSTNFILDYEISNLPQLVLFVLLLVFRKQIDQMLKKVDKKERSKIEFVRLMCYYDFFVVPIIHILGIYRGYEFFYIARLIMWGELISIMRKRFTKQSQLIVSFGFIVFFFAWMTGRLAATYESSHLMPYIFGLF